jgi:transposase-like protein
MKHNSKRHIFKENKEEILKLKQQGASHVEIAKRFGVSDATVSYWLKGRKKQQKHRNKDQIIGKEYLPPKGWNLVFNSMRAIT